MVMVQQVVKYMKQQVGHRGRIVLTGRYTYTTYTHAVFIIQGAAGGMKGWFLRRISRGLHRLTLRRNYSRYI